MVAIEFGIESSGNRSKGQRKVGAVKGNVFIDLLQFTSVVCVDTLFHE